MRTAIALVCVVGLARAAVAQVDCSNPDNLCTGDPCVIDSVEPAEPCVVDFGARAVHIRGLRDVRNVDFTAASFVVLGTINGRVGDGGHFSLTATTGGIVVDASINFTGGATPAGPGDGAVHLVAAQDISIDQPIRLIESPFGGEGAATELLLDAGGDLSVNASVFSLEGAGAFTLRAGGRIDVLAAVKNAQSSFVGNFADVLVEAGGDVVIGGPVSFVDGTITVDAGGAIEVQKPVRTRGPGIVLEAQGDIAANGVVGAVGRAGNFNSCGGVTLLSHAGTVTVTKTLNCSASFASDGVTITAAGTVTLDAKITARVKGSSGGPITVTSTAGSVALAGNLDTRGDLTGGTLQVSGVSVQVDVGRADTRPGGRQEYVATAGDLVLDGSFLAQDGGTIEGTASGDITASGNFRVGPSGCIALAAGGTLNTSAASFDQPVGASCP